MRRLPVSSDVDLDRRAPCEQKRAPKDRLEELSALVRVQRGALAAVACSPEEALECVQDVLATYLKQKVEAGGPSDEQSSETGGHDREQRRLNEQAEAQRLATLKTMVRNAARNA
jgi:hypothetical protein